MKKCPCQSGLLLILFNHSLRLLTLGFALALSAPQANAFSLLCGPCNDCPDSPYSVQPGDIGAAANLGEEYRWNVPVVVYTFDASFLDYFGSAGVAAVESAIGILNSLPPASQINPSNFPVEAALINHQAAGLGLLDLKSMTLALLLEQLGLAQPTRNIFVLRDWVAGNPLIVERNFDPFTTAPSHSVNDTLYNWMLVTSGATNPAPEFADAFEFPVDPLSPTFTAVADRGLTPGMFYTGLTRDDAGGLRYLLRTNNLNLEVLLPGIYGIGTNAGAYVNTALRPGVDKITFVRRDYDSILGQVFSPFTNQFTDIFITNNEAKQQWVERVVTEPDIVFTVTVPAAGERRGQVFSRTGTSNWWNSASIIGLPGVAGPGVIRPSVRIAFHKFTPTVFTSDDSTAGTAQFTYDRWGSFDSSTNPPAVYPMGTIPGGGQLTVRLFLHPENDHTATTEHVWQLPVAFGSGAALEMSNDLNTWVQIAVVTNLGQPVEWDHVRSHSRKFYRVVPQ
jgi:hypothetical protein